MKIEVVNEYKNANNSPRKSKKEGIVEFRAPLLPKKTEDQQGSSGDFNGGSFTGSVFNLSTTIIGAGIMALPATMKVLGLGPGIAIVVLVAFLAEASIDLLLRFSRIGGSVTYGGVMADAFGNFGRTLFQVCVLINNVGILVVYMIIIGDVLSGTSSHGIHHAGVMEGWFGEHWWTGRTFVLLVTTLTVFAPLACFKRIDSLRFTSALAVGLAVVFLAITAGITVFKLLNGSIAMPRLLPQITDIHSVWKLFTAFPVIATSYICHFNVHTIGNELEDSSSMQSVVRTSLALCSTVYIMISFFGFLLFGDSTLDDVLANFDANLGIPHSSVVNDSIRVSYALHLMLVFPMVFYPLRLSSDALLFPSARPLVVSSRRFMLLSISLISIIFVGANYVPSIWDAFQFTGSTATVCLGFIFPAAIALRDPHGMATKRDKILSVFMIGVAVFANLVAIYSNVHTLFMMNASSIHDLSRHL